VARSAPVPAHSGTVLRTPGPVPALAPAESRTRGLGVTVLTRLLLAITTVATMATGVPAAHAAVLARACAVVAAPDRGSEEEPTAYWVGYAVFDDGGAHTVTCTVVTDEIGYRRSTTTHYSAPGVAVTYAHQDYLAPIWASVELCTEIDGVTVSCQGLNLTVVPANEVTDPVATAEPVFCPTLAGLAPGAPGFVDIGWDGDTTVAGVGPVWDCAPYGDFGVERPPTRQVQWAVDAAL
jgi:hypothetical protein